ncbi:MAG TPA: OstA-like protein [Chitinophaga sp.]|uniref:OstA-like protein n=1 Tax=Chitinophaga sp. TaxID=1869181 RepID=UPI002DB96467|nr:OstA-like protein [Chitinophaga sp.]HEU4551538.1 OstA-like protein [Chitinophaga sp.]
MQHLIRYGLVLIGIYLLGIRPALAQQKNGDSTSVIHILHADTLNNITRDSVQLARFIGNASFRQGNTIISCDSAFKNGLSNQLDAYGHVHINQADSVQVYGDYLHYEGNAKMATLRGNARLTDGKVNISGPELQYDMNARIGTYTQGGKLINGSSVLTSKEGYYYADTKDVYFKYNVLLIDPSYTLTTDTLLYNTDTKIATMVAPTTINDGKTVMYTTSGYYNTETGYGNFGSRPTIVDSASTITADNIETDKTTGYSYATGNMVYRDTANHMSLLSNYGKVNQANKTVLATQHPLLILERQKDTLYMVADTLFSGVMRGDSIITAPVKRPGVDSLAQDTAAPEKIKAPLPLPPADSLATLLQPDTTAPAAADTILQKAKADTANTHKARPAAGKRQLQKNNDLPVPDLKGPEPLAAPGDTAKPDTVERRYILAYHHVRIFSDSLQGVADSLYYSSRDSVFRFYRNPVLWANDTQLSGDTIYLYTKNQQADKLVLQPNALIVNEAEPDKPLYNQIKGNIITGYFVGNALDWMHVDGNAESIYYVKDDEGGFISVNKSLSAIINIHFKGGELNKVVFIKDPEGTMYPFTQRPKEELLLENFHWDIKRKPKSKYELMGQ